MAGIPRWSEDNARDTCFQFHTKAEEHMHACILRADARTVMTELRADLPLGNKRTPASELLVSKLRYVILHEKNPEFFFREIPLESKLKLSFLVFGSTVGCRQLPAIAMMKGDYRSDAFKIDDDQKRMVLDGQQRLSALSFLVFFNGLVPEFQDFKRKNHYKLFCLVWSFGKNKLICGEYIDTGCDFGDLEVLDSGCIYIWDFLFIKLFKGGHHVDGNAFISNRYGSILKKI